MSRTPNIVNPDSIERLKLHIKEKSGISGNSFREIQQLICYIKKDTEEYLSVQTLNRFYGLITSNFSPSLSTLNILSLFLNYCSFEEFEKLSVYKNSRSSLHTSVEKLFQSLFFNSYTACNDKNLKWIFHNLYCMIEKNEILPEDIYPLMAQSPFGRNLFYEQFVYIDKLNGWYGDSLKYLEMQVTTCQEKIFVWSTLCCKYFLNNDCEMFNLYFKKIDQIDKRLLNNIDMLVIARYNAARIYEVIMNNKPVTIISELETMISQPVDGQNKSEEFFNAACIIAKPLILGKFFAEAYNFLNSIKSNLLVIKDVEDRARFNEFKLLKFYAGFAAGVLNDKNIFTEIEKIQTGPFHLLTKEYYTAFLNIFYLSSENKSKVKQAKQNLVHFINTTSFHFFSKFISEK